MNALTPWQRAVLDAIRQSVTERGYPPSIRELGEAVGLVSESSVTHQLRALQAKGYIVREHGRSRAIRVLDPQEADHG